MFSNADLLEPHKPSNLFPSTPALPLPPLLKKGIKKKGGNEYSCLFFFFFGLYDLSKCRQVKQQVIKLKPWSNYLWF